MAAPETDMLTTAPTYSPFSSLARQGSLTLCRKSRLLSAVSVTEAMDSIIFLFDGEWTAKLRRESKHTVNFGGFNR